MKLILALAFCLLASLVSSAQTSLSALTGNNTSACAQPNSPSYCKGGFVGLSDSYGTYDPVPGNVSTQNIHGLIPSGTATKVLAHFQPWFCMNAGSTSTGTSAPRCGGHLQIGYNSNDSSAVAGQMDDMRRRGFDGVAIDWYGPTLSGLDQVSQKIRSNLNGRCSGPQSCPLYMALMEDQGAFYWDRCPNNGSRTASAQTDCITAALSNDLDFMNNNYFGANSYLKLNSSKQVSSSGNPVVLFFICQGCFNNPSPDWNAIWSNVWSHSQTFSNPPLFIFENATGFTHPATAGGYAWMNWYGSSDTYGLVYLDDFYDVSVTHGPLVTLGAAWKGFDDTNAPWRTAPARVSGQQCGRTFLQSVQQMTHNSDYSSTNPLPLLGVVTWNDYEEGTEIETGINNCLSLNASVAGSTLLWDVSFSSSSGSESTVHHYTVFDSTNTSNLVTLATVSSGTHSLNLNKFKFSKGTHTLYVQAVGQPSILNKMSAGVSYRAR